MTNKFFTLMLFIAASLITSCSSDDDGPQGPIEITIEGATLEPEVGGPNQQNQVYVDLSTSETASVRRDAWDLGFYSGSDFRVVLNSSLFMRAAELNVTDIDAVNSSSEEIISAQSILTGFPTFDASNLVYVDDTSGDINNTAISAVSNTDTNNKVFLINLGDEVGTETPSTGSLDLSDEPRGWMKIRVLRDGDNYLLQYADLDATTHNEVSISKNQDYNFTFFSLINETEVIVEPIKEEWDLNFSPNTSEVFFGPGNSAGAYFFGDFVASNNLGGTKVYMIDSNIEGEIPYENFEFMNIDNLLFTNNRAEIGSTWRNGGGPGALPSLKDNVYYIINDSNGNYYKLKFLAMFNSDGERGFPQFEYSLLEE